MIPLEKEIKIEGKPQRPLRREFNARLHSENVKQTECCAQAFRICLSTNRN